MVKETAFLSSGMERTCFSISRRNDDARCSKKEITNFFPSQEVCNWKGGSIFHFPRGEGEHYDHGEEGKGVMNVTLYECTLCSY